MEKGIMTRTVIYKGGKQLVEGTNVLIAQKNENTYLVRDADISEASPKSTLEYLVLKDAVKINKEK